MKRYLLILIIVVNLITGKLCADNGTTAANFLKLMQGNRASAMGGSFAAFADGAEAVYWNPAGLANGLFNEAKMVYNDWVEGIYYGYAAYRHNLPAGGFGIGATYLNSGSITRREDGRDETGSSYSMENIAIDAGQGLRVTKNFNAGVLLRFIYETVDGNAINGMAGGVGGQFHKKVNVHYLSIGAAVMNIGTRMGHEDKFPLPALARFGIGDEILNGRFRGSAQVDYYFIESRIGGGTGFEFNAAPFLDLRCGYKFGYKDLDALHGITAGLGIKYIEKVEYIFDYTISSLGDLGMINRFGFGVKF